MLGFMSSVGLDLCQTTCLGDELEHTPLGGLNI